MAAQDAELKLKVSLDLAFFRQQLNTVSTQLGGQPLQLNVKFDRKTIADQYRLLDTYLSRKTFKVKVESPTLDTLVEKVARFKDNLKALQNQSVDLKVNVESKIRGQDAADARRELIKSITGPKGAVFIPIEIKPPLVKNINAIKKDIKERLSGIVIEIDAKVRNITGAPSSGQGRERSAGFEAARKDIAGLTVEQLRTRAFKSLGQESRSAQQVSNWLDQIVQQGIKGADKTKQLNAVRDFLADALAKSAGSNIQARLQPIRGQQQTSAPRSMSNLNEMLDRMANLTENPRAAQRMLRMIPESRITTDLVGIANRQAEFRQEGLKFLDLKGKAFDPLFDAIAQSFTNYTRSVNPSNPWVGKIGNGVKKLVERALALSPEEMFGGRAPVASSKLLPAAGQSSASRMMRTAFSGLPAITSPQIGGENAPLSRAASYMVNKARRALGMPIGPSSPYEPNPFAGAATVPSRSFFSFGQGPQLPGAPIQAALPPAGTTTNYGGGGFFGYGGVSGSGGGGGGKGGALAFPGGAMGKAEQLSSSYLTLGKVSAELRKFEGFFNTNKLPLAGAIEELAGEFGNATKQVLLYGTAYKALAFFMDLPNQALNAAKSLQTFNNQLNAITGSSENADRAFTFVDNLAARFNVPLESARQGFVKLYASMAPAGFSSGEIENLFTGISKASATLGLSSDKVDRVTYAFSQMASKGQLMSEEVSGQLGDVIPGALSIMAEAARMDIATFKKAMEDGVFVGETFKQVMSNVPIVLENRFGKGAAGAAKTLQGSMNALAISTQKFYESFEPIVSMGAASIFPIIATAVNDATQAVQAFTAAMQGNTTPAQMLEGNAAQIYGVLQQLREIFTAVAGIIRGIAPTLMILGKAFLTTAEYIAKLINTPIGGFLADIAVKAGIALVAIQLLAKTGIAGLVSQLLLLYRSITIAGGGLSAFTGALGRATIASKAFRLALTGFAAGIIIQGIETLIVSIGKLANRLDDARKKALATQDAIKGMSFAELGAQKIETRGNLAALDRAEKNKGVVKGRDLEILRKMGVDVKPAGRLNPLTGEFTEGKVDVTRIQGFREVQKEILTQTEFQQKNLYTPPQPLNEVDLGAGGGGEKPKRERQLRDFNSEAIAQLRDNQRIAEEKLKQQQQLEIIDETEYEIASAANKRKFELLIIEEALAQKKADIGEYQAGVREKQLAVFEQLAANERKLVEEEEKTAVQGAKIKLVRPFKDAIRDENIEISKQGILLDNLRQGYDGLTAEQEANLIIEDKTRELKSRQQKLVETEIKNLREVTIERIKAARALQIEQRIKGLRDELALLRAVSEEERKRLQIAQENQDATPEQLNKIYDLKKVRDNIAATREIIDNFVNETSSDYKGFLKAVISGEDAVDALEKFQQGLKDRVLTIFLDFTMKPVEDYFKNVVGGGIIKKLFPEQPGEKAPEADKAATPVEQKLDTANATLDKIEQNTRGGGGGAAPSGMPSTPQSMMGAGSIFGAGAVSPDVAAGGYAGFIGDSSVLASTGITLEDYSGSFQSSFADISESAFGVTEDLNASADTLKSASEKTGEGSKGLMSNLGGLVQGIGQLAGSVMTIYAGIQQINKGDTGSVIAGIGSILMGAGGIFGMFGANGGVAKNGWKPFPAAAFANGGTVSGPTLGLVGEGKYNEAIVPLPDGRSIPVKMQGSIRDKMQDSSRSSTVFPMLNMSFETTSIGGVDYVSRDQLEQAMMETRRLAAKDGAQRGASLALDKLQQSPNTRRRVGLR